MGEGVALATSNAKLTLQLHHLFAQSRDKRDKKLCHRSLAEGSQNVASLAGVNSAEAMKFSLLLFSFIHPLELPAGWLEGPGSIENWRPPLTLAVVLQFDNSTTLAGGDFKHAGISVRKVAVD